MPSSVRACALTLAILASATAHATDVWLPVDDYGTLTCGYGCYTSPFFHAALDFGIPEGTPVYAPISGWITRAKNDMDGQTCNYKVNAFGNFVEIEDGPMRATLAHLKKGSLTKTSGWVEAGELVGYSSNTGYTIGAHGCEGGGGYHVHFELEIHGVAVNPTDHFTTWPPRRADPSASEPVCETVVDRLAVVAAHLDGEELSTHFHDLEPNGDVYLGDLGPVVDVNLSALRDMQVADLDGDGWDDILHVVKSGATDTVFYVRRSRGDGTFASRRAWKTTSRTVSHTFAGDWDGDGRPDLVLGLPVAGGKMEWRVCMNERGAKFADACIHWRADTSDGTFGDTTSDFVLGDFNADRLHRVELLRGKKYAGECTTSRQWKRLGTTGQRNDIRWNTNACHGFDGGQFFAANVDDDPAMEFVYVRATDDQVEVFVSDYDHAARTMRFRQWANDVGGASGTYAMYDITRDGRDDLLRHRDRYLAYSPNLGGRFAEQSQQRKLAGFSKVGQDRVLFGEFGVFEDAYEVCEP